MNMKLRDYMKKAKDKYSKIIKKPEFEAKYKETGVFGDHDLKFKKKVGYFRRSCILYEARILKRLLYYL